MEQTVKTLKPVCSLLDRCFNFVLSFLQLSPSWHLCSFLAMELSQLSYSWNVQTIGNQHLWRDSGHDLSAKHIAWLPPQSWHGSYGTESQIGTKQCTLSRTHTQTHTHTHTCQDCGCSTSFLPGHWSKSSNLWLCVIVPWLFDVNLVLYTCVVWLRRHWLPLRDDSKSEQRRLRILQAV